MAQELKQNEPLTGDTPGAELTLEGLTAKEVAQLKEDYVQALRDREKEVQARKKVEAELDQATKVVVELKEKLAEKTEGTVSLPVVTVGKDTYELTTDFTYKGEVVTIEMLKENGKLAAELVKEGIANLRKLVK